MLAVKADTICIHGDAATSVEFASMIFKTLLNNGIAVKCLF